jgi:hypothetical protein
MADDQPGEQAPAAGPVQPSAPAADPTRVEPGEAERSTLDAPARWSGWAAVPTPAPRRSLWSLRRTPPAPPERAMSPEAADWAATPAVDPWAGNDTPWDPMPIMVPPELPPTRPEQPLPPTRLDPPAALPSPALPPPALPSPALPPPALPSPALPSPTAPQAAPPPVAAPPVAPQARRRRWGAKKPRQPAPAADRIPVAPRPSAPPPLPRPQAWRPPPQARPPLPPPRRRRRWGRRVALFTLFSVVCCCGVPIAYLTWSPARQYPVRAVLPASVADLSLRDDSASRRAVARLTHDLTDANAQADQIFAGVYGDGSGKRVTIFGTTGFRLTPGSDVEAELDHLNGDYDLRDIATYDLGEPGAHERCGVGDTGGTSVVVCSWADHGSLATVITTRRSAADSAALTAILRNAVLTHP